MRNKKLISGLIAICTAATLLSGCQSITNPVNESKTEADSKENNKNNNKEDGNKTNKPNKNAGNDDKNTTISIEDIKSKYSDSTTVEYTEALYNLERDHIFTYNITETYFDLDISEYDFFSVYYDAELTNYADVSIYEDYDTMTITISPNLMFDYNESGSLTDDGTWGTRSKFYLVQYRDLTTGVEFEKPLVTVFTVKDELPAPTLTQQMGDDGFYYLTWTEVEGADYYEVYEFWEGADGAFLEYTTTETFGSYENFETNVWHMQRFIETYGGTEIDVTHQWTMNDLLDVDTAYFVVAKTNDGKQSAMSNECYVGDIGNQIPYMVSDDFIEEYSGDSVLALPAYVDVQMVDGSTGQFLIEYLGATVTLLDYGRIFVEPTIKNLPIEMPILEFTGLDFDTFMSQTELLKTRTSELSSNSVTFEEDINIPHTPPADIDEPEVEEPEIEEPEVEIPEIEDPEEDNLDISLGIMDTIYANSALSEWITINLLAHNEEISLADFLESANTEYLNDAFLEAYNQNPLCGIIYSAELDYSKNALLVEYVLDKDSTIEMQNASISKACEIIEDIIDSDMTDYEKENAINTYLCENAEYNYDIMEYIKSDGSISEDAVLDFANSFTPYGILMENFGVCESYSEAFLLLCQAASLDAIIETGKLNGVNHEWNRVKIDGNWYIMDITNNDNENLPNCYFNLSDDTAKGILIADSDSLMDDFIDNYAADSTKYEYYTMNELFIEDEDVAVDMLVAALEDKDMAVIRISRDTTETEVFDIVKTAVNEANVTNAVYYFNNGVLSIIKK